LTGERRVDWDGCVNVRDLGGLGAGEGRKLRTGLLFRADDLGRLTERGWDELVSLGSVRVIDLRFAGDPGATPPKRSNVDVRRVELMPADDAYWLEMDANLEHSGSAAEHLGWQYLHLLQNFPSRVAAAVETAVTAPGLAVVHCRVGKDRTGIVVAVILRLLGVSRTDVELDYAESAEAGRIILRRWIEAAPDPREAERRRWRSEAPTEAMSIMLEGLERELGGAEGYLRAAGLSEELIESFRARLLADEDSSIVHTS
jgi:protein-tyrosine phosphatase